VLVYELFDRIVHEYEIRHQRTLTHHKPCTVYLRSLEFRCTSDVSLQVWRYNYAASEAIFEAKACDEIGTGFGGCRVDLFASGGRIGIGRADSGHSADTERGTGSRNHPR
jgi:hypothetical protein